MSIVNWNSPKVQEQVHRVIKEMTEWNEIKTDNIIRQHTEEYYNGKLVSSIYFSITPYEFKNHMEKAMNQSDCVVSIHEDDCIAKVTREQQGVPKKFVTKYHKEKSI